MYPIKKVLEVLDLSNKNYSFRKIAKITKITRQTISIWVKKYKMNLINLNERLKNVIKNKYNFTNIELNKFVLNLIYLDPFITRKEIQFNILKEFKIQLNVNKITQLYKFLKLSFKKPFKSHCKRYKILR